MLEDEFRMQNKKKILNKLIKECGSQLQLAKRLNISQPFISKLLYNNADISVKLAKKISNLFDIPFFEIRPDLN